MNNVELAESDILVVDDNLIDLTIIKSILIKQGYLVRTALSGELALASVREKAPDMILLDVMMPEMDGYQLCKQLKANPDPDIRSIPLIFISALGEAVDKKKAFSFGGVDYVTKPFDQGEILARIETHLRLRRIQAELIDKNAQLHQEIDERTRVEQSLRESQRTLAALMGNLPGMAYRCYNDLNWTMLFVSKGCLGLTGYQAEDILYNHVCSYHELIHPDDREMVRKTVQTAVQKERPFQITYRLRMRDGEEKWVWEQGLQIVSPEYEHPLLEGFITDITQQVQAEKRLQESEERFKRALENIPDVVVIYDADLKIQYINSATRQITSRPVSDYIGKREEEIWPPEVYNMYLPTLQEAADTQKICSIDTDLSFPNGQTRSLRITCVPISNEKGQLREVLGITQDFTEREQAQKSLLESLAKWESLVRYAPYFIAIMDRDGRLHFVNQLHPGFNMEDVIGSSNYDYIDPQYHAMVKQKVEHVFYTGQSVTYEIEAAGINGGQAWYETRVSPLILDDEVAFVTMISLDITARKQIEEELRQSENRLSVIFNHTSDLQLLAVVEPDGIFRIVAVNKPYIETAKSFGVNVSAETYVGKTIPEAISSLGLGQEVIDYTLNNYRQAADSGEPVQYSESISLEKGTFHSEISLIPVLDQDNRCKYVLYNSHNVTDLRQTAEALKKLNAELDERVRERTADLNKTVQLMAGREVRMAELKKVIKQLRKQLQDVGMKPIVDDPLNA